MNHKGDAMRTNYPAVFVSALAYWILGAVWYAVLFSKPWMALEHITDEQPRSLNPVLPYIISFVLNLLIAFVLAQICIWRKADSAGRGAAVGGLVWIGVLGSGTYTTYMFGMRAKGHFAIKAVFSSAGFW